MAQFKEPLKLLRLQEVLDRVPVGKTRWFAGVQNGEFPAQIKLGTRISVWLESDIDEFIEKIANQSKKSTLATDDIDSDGKAN